MKFAEKVKTIISKLRAEGKPEHSNNWRKYHGLPLKRRGGKRRGRRKGNGTAAKNADVS